MSFAFIYFFSKTAFKPFHATGLFLYPLKHQKTSCFLMFSGGIERNQWHELGWIVWCRILLLIFWVVVCQDSTKKKKACQLLFSILEIFMRCSNIYKALQKRVKNLDPIFLPVEITDFFFFFWGGGGVNGLIHKKAIAYSNILRCYSNLLCFLSKNLYINITITLFWIFSVFA